MDVDEASPERAVNGGEVELANAARGPVMVDAGLPGAWVPLIGVDSDQPACAFEVEAGCGNVLGRIIGDWPS